MNDRGKQNRLNMDVLDLFSGIGGFSLGLHRAGFNTVAFCEIDKFCQKVLAKNFPDVPIYSDITTIREELKLERPIGLLCGGYPCQPFSNAGLKKGEEDDRYLWHEMFACIQTYKPRWVIGENVANHINLGFDTVLSDLESEGYSTTAFVVPACAVNAPHRRDRLWIVAHSDSDQHRGTERGSHAEKERVQGKHRKNDSTTGRISGTGKGRKANDQHVTNPDSERLERLWGEYKSVPTQETGFSTRCGGYERIGGQWQSEPNVGRVANGISNRVDRLRALGNAVVPQIVEIIGHAIMEVEHGRMD